jgi:large repetitive protein
MAKPPKSSNNNLTPKQSLEFFPRPRIFTASIGTLLPFISETVSHIQALGDLKPVEYSFDETKLVFPEFKWDEYLSSQFQELLNHHYTDDAGSIDVVPLGTISNADVQTLDFSLHQPDTTASSETGSQSLVGPLSDDAGSNAPPPVSQLLADNSSSSADPGLTEVPGISLDSAPLEAPVDGNPEAILDAASSGRLNIPMLFDASGSHDNEGPITRYVFDFGDGTSYSETADNAPDGDFDGKTTHSFNKAGSFETKVTVTDGQGATGSTSKVVQITNDAPIANNDSATLNEDSSVKIAVLANDSDPNGDKLSITGVTGASHGTLVTNTDGTITYTASANYNGTDSFTYTVSDGLGSFKAATVNITVVAVNDDPKALNDVYSVNEDSTLNIGATSGLLSNDTDIDKDSLSVLSFSQAGNGSVSVNPDGSFSYTPKADWSGTDTFSYIVSDGHGGTSAANVTINVNPVNDAPNAHNDSVSLNEDSSTTFNVLNASSGGADSDVDGDTLSVVSITNPSHGFVSFSSAGDITYTPDADFYGTDSFTYIISDGHGGTDLANVQVTINPVNDLPTATSDSYSIAEDGILSVPALNGVLANDSDVDQDGLSVVSYTQAAHGVVAMSPDGTFSYTPNPNYNGTDSFTYVISDGNGGTSTATVNVTVASVNDAPVAVNDTVSTAEDTPITINVKGNDTDVDGDTLTVQSVTQGTKGAVSIVSGQVLYTPNANYNGTDSFTYIISDGNGGTSTATVNVTVTPVNDAPVAVNDTVSTAEDTPITINVKGNDTDVDGDILTVQSVTQGTKGTVSIVSGQVLYTPNANYNGTDSFTYTISDGNGGTSTATVNVTVTPVNDAPVAVNDTVSTAEDTPITINVKGNDTDVDGDTLTVQSVTQGAKGTVSIVSGQVLYTPNANYNGTDSFTYVISDGNGGTSTATVNVTVTPVNDAPVAVNDTVTTAEDTPITINAKGNDTDVDGDTLTVQSVTQGAKGTVSIVSGQVLYTPNANYNGTDSFTYVISDENGGTSTATVNVTITPVNDAPVAVNDAATTAEDTPITINVKGNDTDVDEDTLTVQSVTQGTKGTVSIVSGQVLYTPNANYNGTDSFTYTISDGNGGTSTATVNVTVTPVNDAPIAVNDTATTAEDTPITINVKGNDTDVDGDTLTVKSVTQGAKGTVSIVSGQVLYTPNANYNGTDSFTYTISDGNGGTSTATVNVTVTPVNDAPVAVNDTVTTAEDTPITINVKGNDTDVDGDTLTVQSVNQGTKGTVSIVSGQVLYTPNANYNGTDSFTYVVSDGNGGTSTATVNVTITPVNDAPVAVNDTVTTAEDTPITINVKGNDTDVDGDTLTVQSVTQGTKGSVSIVSGQVLYTPNANYNGTDSFTYTISDGNGGTSTATVNVTVAPVNDAPIAVNDAVTTAEDTPITINVQGNDTDVDGDTLTVQSVTQGAKGTVSIVSGQVLYTPNANYNGTDSFTYVISDGNGGTSTATVNVTVMPVNDAPVAVNDTVSTAEDTPVTISVLSNDTDVDGDTLTVQSVTQGAKGTVSIVSGQVLYTPNANYNGTDSFTYVISDGNGGTSTATVNVTITPVNDAPVAVSDTVSTAEDTPITINVKGNDTDVDGDTLTVQSVTQGTKGTVSIVSGQVLYTPNANYNGTDSFTYVISDGNGGTSTATVNVTVTPVNDAPVAVNDTATTAEDTPVTINVKGNDTDVDGDTLTVQSVTQGTKGTVSIVSGQVLYTPNANYNGTDSFTYTISDGNGGTSTATVNVTVTPVNDAPVAVNDTVSTAEDTPITINVKGNDTDVDGDTLTVQSVTQGAKGTVSIVSGQVLYTPNANYNGTDSFTYTISDGNGGTSTTTVNVTVTPVNDAPVAVNDTVSTAEDTPITINVKGNDTDVDGDTLTVQSVTQGIKGTVSIVSGQVLYTPNANYNGTDSFTYTISDGNGGTSTATVNVTITPVNDAPVAVNDTVSTGEDTSATINVKGNDTDVDGDTLTVQSVTQGTNGTVSIVSGQVLYTPNANYNGTDSFTYTISDGNGGTSTATVNVTVTPVNDAPVAVNDTVSTAEDTPVTISVLSNDTDVENDTLTITTKTNGANGTVTIVGNQLKYTPNANYNGTDSFTYVINDGNGGTSTATVNVTITPVNDAPVAVNDTVSTAEDTPITINVKGNDTDVDGDTLTVQSVTQGTKGSVSIVSGQVKYTPNANYNGTDSFTYTISDGNGGTDIATVNVTVTSVNDAPVAANDTATTAEDTPITINVKGNDTDVDGDTLTVQSVTQGAKGTVSIVSGQILYTPNANYNGTDSFTYTISDGNGGTSTATVNVTVTPVNDAPVAVNDTTTTAEDTSVTINVKGNDTDVDGDTLTVQSVTQGTKGTVSIVSGQVLYIPNANYNGTDSFTYVISDGNGGTSTATVNITVTPVNDAPVAVNDTVSTAEDTPITINVKGNDTDVDGDTLTVQSVTQGAKGTVSIVSGQVLYTPNANYNGTDSFTYTIGDGNGGTSTATVNVTVTQVNDAPVAVNDTVSTAEDTPITINVKGNDTDVDGDTLTVQSVTQGAKGTVSIVSGQVKYTPNANYNGTDSFTYVISDGNGGTSTATVNVTVTPVNDAPVAVNDTTTTAEDTPITINVKGNDTDVDGDTLTVQSVTQGTKGTVSIVSGQVLYTPNANYNGTDSFTYVISDGNGGTSTATVNVTVTPVNDAPVAVNDAVTTAEDTPITINVKGNDTDVDGDTLTVQSVTQGAKGTVSIVSGQVLYTPNANYNGTDSFTYVISDGNGGTSTATVNVTVTPVNDAPVAVNDTATTAEDTPITINVKGNDTDVDGDTLTVQSVTQGIKGTVSIVSGQVLYTPNANYNGTDSFTYVVSDGNGGTSTATVNITVTSVNDAPVAVNDTVSTAEDTPITINVKGNDTDVDGDTLTVQSVTQGAKGTVSIVSGQVLYTPNANYNGTDSFTYVISDGNGGTSTATVNVTVSPVNDAPVAMNDIATTAEDTPITINVKGNDTDVDGDTLTIQSVTQGTKGTVSIVSGQVLYTPNANYNGTDSFTYTINDGNGGTSTATVNVTVTPVNDAPVAVNDTVSTAEDTPVTISVLSNDTDVENDTLTITTKTNGANGTVTIVGNQLKYTPNANYNGTDSFTYTISDGNGGTSTAIVNVTVTPVNDAPVAVNDTVSTAEDTPITINVRGNDTDVDGDTLTVQSVTQGTKGTVSIVSGQVLYTPNANYNGTDSFTYTISDGNGGTSTATVNVTVTPVNDAPVAVNDTVSTAEDTPITINVKGNDIDVDGDTLTVQSVTQGTKGTVSIVSGQVLYTPNANYNGTDSFTYVISDGNGGTSAATVNVTVIPVNDAPVAVNDTVSTAEDTPITINVKGNDTDVDGDTLTVQSVTQGAKGTVSIVSGQVLYTPNANYNGTDSFTYTISDGNDGTSTATVNVTVTPVNDAPVAVNDTVSTAEDTPVMINVKGNDIDVDGDTLTVQSVTQGAKGTVSIVSGQVLYTPNANYNGTDSFTYVISDGNGGTSTATVNVTVTPVNDAPVAVNDTVSTAEDTPVMINVKGNDIDVDGDTLTVQSVTQGTKGTVSIVSGQVLYTPNANYNGTDSFTYVISDGNGGTSAATVNVTVTPVNDAPVAVNDTVSTAEDTPVTINVKGNDTDVDGDTLTVQSVTQGAKGTVSIVSGQVLYTPNANYNGTDSFTYVISDGNGGTSTATVNVTITPVNDAPVAMNDIATTAEDTPVTISVLSNDTDVENDTLTITAKTNGANGTVAIVGNQLKYTPNANYNGTDSFTYIISDGNGGTSTATVNVTVTPVNDAPIAVNDTVSTAEDTPITINVKGNDTDVDGDILTVQSVTQGAKGTVSIVSGQVLYTPNANYNGTDSFTYTISDGNGGTSTATVNVTITPVNDAPVAINDTVTTAEDTPITINVKGNDTDVDGDTLTVQSVTQGTKGTVSIVSGQVLYTPNANYNGTDSFTYVISDGNGGTSTATVNVTVTPVNDAPIAVNDTATTAEDTPITINVKGNDTDVDGDTLTVQSVTQGAKGTVSIVSGQVLYTPNANYNGTDSFTYVISDGNGGTSTATVNVTITPVNDAPVAINDTVTTAEDTPITINVKGNDTDVDGDTLTVQSVTQGTKGTVSIVSGQVLYTPNANYNGTDSFTYVISDGNGGTSTAIVNVTVTPVNDAPIAVNDTATTAEDTPITINVKGNDTDVDGDILTVQSVTQGAKGTVSIVSGQVLYTPNANYNGTDSFTYTISDGNGGTSTATVNVTVTPVNDAPVAINDTVTTAEDTPITINVKGNDTDVDGDTLTVQSVTQGTKGTVSIVSGQVLYTPNANYNGTDSFTYVISDGNGGTSTATVNVTVTPVNDAPVAVNDTATTAEDTPLTINVKGNDTDVDGDTLTVQSVTQGAKGIVSIVSGQVLYTPNANYNGTDSFTYVISDGNGGTSTATVNVTVTPVNDAPVAINDTVTTAEDTPMTISVLSNDTDVENDTLTITTKTNGANGIVTIVGNQLKYTPNANYNGTDSFTYVISDGNGGTSSATVNVTVTPVNDAPVAVNDAVSTAEDTPITINVKGNDTDVDGDTLTVQSVTQGTKGTVSIVSGQVKYTPNANYNGTDSFTYTISDGNGGTSTATVNVTVTPVNDAPIAVNDTATTVEDTPITINVKGNDTDVDGDTLTVQSVTQGTKGTVSIVSGQVLYTPNANYNGTDSFTYVISDGNGGTSTAIVNVTVTPVNDAPVAVNDTVTTAEDTPITINVKGNDTDVDGDTLTVQSVTQGIKGTVSIVSGQVLYTPNANYNGTDSFTYVISDGNGGTSTATVNVTVTPVNDAPVAVNDTATTAEDTPITINVKGNDTDVDGDTLTVQSVTQGAKGTVSIVGGQVLYTPNANYNGTDSFTYVISDGNGGTSTATVNVTVTPVNDAPVAVNDTATTAEDTPITINVKGNDTDVDGDTLTVQSVTQGTKGTVSIVSGQVKYTPNANYNGTDSFTYVISDGNGGTSTATVNVTVTPVNDVPVAVNDTATTAEDTPITINVKGNDTDVDGDTLTVQSVTQGTKGTVSIVSGQVLYTPNANYNGTDSFTYVISDGNGGTSAATVNVTVTPVNDAPVAVNDAATTAEDTPITINVKGNDTDVDGDTLTVQSVTQGAKGTVSIVSGQVLYTPNANYNGTDSFTYVISDGNGGTSTAIVNVTITPVNDAPVAVNDTVSTAEDTPITINVKGNDTDVDGDTLTVQSVTQGAKGTVSIVSGQVLYTPNANYNGTDSFTYVISDGNGGTSTATVNVTVTSVNDAPVAANDAVTTAEDTPITINVKGNDTDVDGDTLTVQSVTQGAKGTVSIVSGQVLYTPNANYNGTDSFTYVISDGNGGTSTATVNVTITPVNDAPVAVNDTATTAEDTPITINVKGNDTDVDGDTLTVQSVTQGAKGTVSIVSGQVLYTPNANYNGTDSFTYVISDGNGGTSTATVNVTVTPVNDAPVAVNDAVTTAEDTPITINVKGNDTDVDGDTLTVQSVTQGAKGTVSIVSGQVVYTPNANYNGTDSFTYVISDGNGGTSTATVNVTVTPVNDAPVAVNDTVSTAEDTPVTINVKGNDTDVDGDTLTVQSVTQGTKGTVSIVSGQVKYTPNANYNGTDSFTYIISDGNGGTSTATVNVTVTPVNDAPIAVNDTATTAEDTPITINVKGNDTDVDGDTLTVQSVTQGAKGTVSIVSGQVLYTPNANYNGTDSFTYVISDGNGGTSTATVNVTITPVNDAPVAVNDTVSTAEDTPVTISVLSNDTDVENDTLTITTKTNGANGTVTIVGNQLKYTPNANYNGTDSFTYVISDGNGGTSTATVNVTVTPVNDAPVAVNDTVSTAEDTPITINVKGNDTDVDGDTLTVQSVTQGTKGTVSIVSGQVKYTPNANYNGTDSFTYVINDGNGGTSTATVNVTVTPVNDAPVAVNDTVSTAEDTPITINVKGNDTDVDGDTLTVQSVTQGTKGTVSIVSGQVKYTPNANYNGTDSFTYVISDGNGGTSSATVNVTITPVNDPPVALNDSYSVNEDTALNVAVASGVLANDSDVDLNTLTVTSFTQTSHGTVAVNPDGSFSYTPTANYNGTDSFTYTISDGNGGTATATALITVAPVNDLPVAAHDCVTVYEDTASVTFNVLDGTASDGVADSDVDGDTLSVVNVSNAVGGTVTWSANGQVTFVPNANFSGKASFDYTLSDGTSTVVATAYVHLVAQNDAPIASNDVINGNEDTVIKLSVLSNDTDPDGNSLTVVGTTQAQYGSVVVNGDGTISYTPNANYFGSDSFIYGVTDGNGTYSTATVTVNVTPVNDAPDAINDVVSTSKNVALKIGVLGNDIDIDTAQSSLTVKAGTTTTQGGTIAVNADKTITYTPKSNYTGTDSFTYTLSDGTSSDTATVSITVGTGSTNKLSGTIYEDVNGDASLSDGIGKAGVTVRLYLDGTVTNVGTPDALDTLSATTTTDANGNYSFNVTAGRTYWVAVDSKTVAPTALNSGSAQGNVWAEQTFSSAGGMTYNGSSYTYSTNSGAAFGGKQGTVSDNAATLLGSEHVIRVRVGTDATAGVDFGFSFNAVTNVSGGDTTDDDAANARSVQGSLRQFIQNANAISGSNAMRFVPGVATNTSGGGGNWWQINVTAALPAITDAGTTIDGMAFSSTNGVTVLDVNSGMLGTGGTVGVDGLPLTQVYKPELAIVESNGSSNIEIGLDLQANNSTVRNIAIYGFGAISNSDANANIRIGSFTGALIERNIVGASASSFTDPGAATRSAGDNIRSTGGTNGVIQYNLIGFAAGKGIGLENGSNNWLVQGNESRGNAIGNSNLDGIDIENSQGATVKGNLFAANEGVGIDGYQSAGSNNISNNTVIGNGIGAGSNVETPGIRVYGSGSTINKNVVGANYGAGIMVTAAATNNIISQNSIYLNGTILNKAGAAASGQVGIDLLSSTDNESTGTGPYTTLNDSGDADTGANGLFNAPVLQTATISGKNITITGFARPGSIIELFISDSTGSGVGEGKTYLATLTEGSAADTNTGTGTYSGTINGVNQGTDTTNRFTFVVPLESMSGVRNGTVITATARTTTGTSEFSANIKVTGDPDFCDL